MDYLRALVRLNERFYICELFMPLVYLVHLASHYLAGTQNGPQLLLFKSMPCVFLVIYHCELGFKLLDAFSLRQPFFSQITTLRQYVSVILLTIWAQVMRLDTFFVHLHPAISIWAFFLFVFAQYFNVLSNFILFHVFCQ